MGKTALEFLKLFAVPASTALLVAVGGWYGLQNTLALQSRQILDLRRDFDARGAVGVDGFSDPAFRYGLESWVKSQGKLFPRCEACRRWSQRLKDLNPTLAIPAEE